MKLLEYLRKTRAYLKNCEYFSFCWLVPDCSKRRNINVVIFCLCFDYIYEIHKPDVIKSEQGEGHW